MAQNQAGSSKKKGYRYKTVAHKPKPFYKDEYYSTENRLARWESFHTREASTFKWLNFEWLQSTGLSIYPFLQRQSLQKVLEFHGPVRVKSVREFFANFRMQETYGQTVVNGQGLEFDSSDFAAVFSMKDSGETLNSDDSMLLKVNAGDVYLSSLRKSELYNGRDKIVSIMKVTERMLLFVITHMLIPRPTGNYSTPNDVDMRLLFGLKENILINWPVIFMNHMAMIAKTKGNQKLPYGMLITKLLEVNDIPPHEDEVWFNGKLEKCCLNELDMHNAHIYKHPVTEVWMWKADLLETFTEAELHARVHQKIAAQNQAQRNVQPVRRQPVRRSKRSHPSSSAGGSDSAPKASASTSQHIPTADVKQWQILRNDLMNHIDARFAQFEARFDKKLDDLLHSFNPTQRSDVDDAVDDD